MEHKLPPLPYPIDALEPHLSAEALEFHYGKHHKAYVDTLNKLIKGTDLENDDLATIVRKATATVFNNAAQAWNHSFFWECMTPDGGGEPSGDLLRAINAKWGGIEAFKEAFITRAVENFGSGWTWLVRRADHSLDIVNTGNANTPLNSLDTPLLTVDVWEHAYYIDYRNERKKFVDIFLTSLVNWEFVQSNYET